MNPDEKGKEKRLRANIDWVDVIILVGFGWILAGVGQLAGLGWMFLIGGIILMAGGIGLALRRSG